MQKFIKTILILFLIISYSCNKDNTNSSTNNSLYPSKFVFDKPELGKSTAFEYLATGTKELSLFGELLNVEKNNKELLFDENNLPFIQTVDFLDDKNLIINSNIGTPVNATYTNVNNNISVTIGSTINIVGFNYKPDSKTIGLLSKSIYSIKKKLLDQDNNPNNKTALQLFNDYVTEKKITPPDTIYVNLSEYIYKKI